MATYSIIEDGISHTRISVSLGPNTVEKVLMTKDPAILQEGANQIELEWAMATYEILTKGDGFTQIRVKFRDQSFDQWIATEDPAAMQAYADDYAIEWQKLVDAGMINPEPEPPAEEGQP